MSWARVYFRPLKIVESREHQQNIEFKWYESEKLNLFQRPFAFIFWNK